MIRIGVIGSAGRMGQMLVREVHATEGLRLTAATEIPDSPAVGRDAGAVAGIEPLDVSIGSDLTQLTRTVDTVIDFTTPETTAALAGLATKARISLVVGTTGLEAQQSGALEQAAKQIPIVWAPNMSVGVNVLLRLVGEAARLLGPDYALEIVEAHHRHKKDAPSGTALRLAEVLAEATSERGSLADRICYGRHGMDLRPADQIGIHAIRGGDIAGEHTVLYCGDGERMELTYRASSRQTYASGAVRAALWLKDKSPGLYGMADVLNL